MAKRGRKERKNGREKKQESVWDVRGERERER